MARNNSLLAGNFGALGTTFNVDDWIAHTPKSILAKNFGVNESLFDNLPSPNPYIYRGPEPSTTEPDIPNPNGELQGNSSYTYHLSQQTITPAPGRGGTIAVVDSRNFPIAKTIASAVVTLEPGGLRELHWHPNVRKFSISNRILALHSRQSRFNIPDPLSAHRLKNGSTSTAAKPARPSSLAPLPPEHSTSRPATRPCSQTIAVSHSHKRLPYLLTFAFMNS